MLFQKITISGKIASGKTTLFWDLFRKLHWPLFSASQFFRDYARNRGARIDRAEEQEEDVTREIDAATHDVLVNHTWVIVEGWMAGMMAKDVQSVLRLFLTCEASERARRVSIRDGLTLKKAQRSIQQREEYWIERIHGIYGDIDLFDFDNYDLVIDTTKKTSQEILDQVLKKLGL